MSGGSGALSLLQVPTAVWTYGFLRALAFAAPFWVGAGTIGLGAVVVAVLYVPLVLGRRWAWAVLVVLDTISLVLLLAAAASSPAGEVPLLVPLLALVALGCLLMPSTRRHVATDADPTAADAPHRPGTRG
jgi:hypothetical protein